jgi:hypothetical protein
LPGWRKHLSARRKAGISLRDPEILILTISGQDAQYPGQGYFLPPEFTVQLF